MCLTSVKVRHSSLHGAEYESTNLLVSNSENDDIPYAVCYVPTRHTSHMVPGKHTCPSGWTTEYCGYLMAEVEGHYRSQYTCVCISNNGF